MTTSASLDAEESSSSEPLDEAIARPHSRGNRVTIVPPDEIIALSDLTGRSVADLVAVIIKRECAVIRARAATLVEAP